MKHKVVSMVNYEYFKFGELFIKTRKNINAEFIIYNTQLSDRQNKILNDNDIKSIKISRKEFENKMMYLKFKFIKEQIQDCDLVTFVDFDTYFINDWGNIIFNRDFDIGITVRNDMVNKNCVRAFANGGVIFTKNNFSLNYDKKDWIIDYALKIMENGNDDNLFEYDIIFKTLENNKRPKHKRHFRSNLRCWCDQVFLSALVMKYFNNINEKVNINNEYKCYNFLKNKIMLLDADVFNSLDDIYHYNSNKNVFIRHLKDSGRSEFGEKTNLLGA